MKLVAIAALIAVCGAAKLGRTYLPPSSAATAGGSSDSLQTPLFKTSEQNNVDPSGPLPTGSYTNNFEGVIVDAAGAGTRASPEGDFSGLGGPRPSYGSENSKVGDAAFRGSLAGFRSTPFGFNGQAVQNGHVIEPNAQSVENGQASGFDVQNEQSSFTSGQNFGAFENKSERPQAFKDRNSNIISYASDVSLDNYSYGFETDNGIAVGENGVAKDGIQAQGGYSYKGDDGQVYKVTYVADEGGYRPQGAHLPTPPPIPKEILESLEKNAKEEAAGLVDDGSYDPQKYNAEGDYTHHNSGNTQYNGAQSSQFAKRPGSDASASNSLINQNSQALNKPGLFGNVPQNTQSNFNGQSNYNGQSNQFPSNIGANQIGFNGQKESSQALNGQQASTSDNKYGQSSGNQVGQSHGVLGTTHIGAQNAQQATATHFGSQSSQFTQTSQQQSRPQFGQSSFGSQLNQQAQAQSGPTFGSQHNKPAFESNFAYNTQQSQIGNQGLKPQASGSEYLPPFNRPQSNEAPNIQSSDKNQVGNIVPQEQTQGPASSFNQVGYKPQTTQSFNGYQNLPTRPNQYNQNNGQSLSNSQVTSLQSNVSPVSGISGAIKPTSIPSIELTTPLETNEKPAFSQTSQFNSQTGQYGGQSVNNQRQPQVGFQNNEADSRPQGSSQFDSSSPAPTTYPTTLQPTKERKPQHQQNFISQNQQNNGYYSTQKPSFSQGPDDSYYYNQPSKPFGTPTRPQGSRFPSTPAFQPNSVAPTQSNQFFNQQGSQSSFNQFQNSVSPASPTPSSQVTQTQGMFSPNYNGITQAEISPFPSVSPTTASQYDTTQPDRFGTKPNVPSFPSKPTTTFGQRPSNSFSQTQTQFSQMFSNNNVPTASQSFPSRPTNVGQTQTTFTQNQFTQTSNNNDQPQNSEIGQEPVTLTQQYNGTLYEYNKPPEVLPASEESDSSSSQSTQTDSSSEPENQESDKQETTPQFSSQQTSFGQNSFVSQSQQPSLNLGSKPQFGTQTYKPFGNTPSGPSQLSQNTQSTFTQQNLTPQAAQVNKPIQSSFTTTSQFGQSFGSQFQFQKQPAKPFGAVSSPSQFGQNSQQQTQGVQYGVQSKPSGGVGSISQFSQNTQLTDSSTQSKPQFNDQNEPIGYKPFSQFGQIFGNAGLSQTVQPATSFGDASQEHQGYPSLKPEIGSQLQFPTHFVQNSQQTFGSSQGNKPITGANSAPVIPGSPESLKPLHSTAFGQQSYQGNQFGQATRPQYGVQAQLSPNQNAGVNPFGSASSEAQVGSNSAQASSSAVNQPSAIQGYRPFATSGSNLQPQNKPQFDQAPETSQGVSSTISPPQFNAQSLGSSGSQGSSQSHTPPCCKSFPGSAIAPLNVGKPSQAFAQTQSQFTGFQGAQGFSAQSLAGKGEQFGGPRQPPSFDAQTGYHY